MKNLFAVLSVISAVACVPALYFGAKLAVALDFFPIFFLPILMCVAISATCVHLYDTLE